MHIRTVRIDIETLDGVFIQDITPRLAGWLASEGVSSGVCVISVPDARCAVTLTDDLDASYEDLIRFGRDQMGPAPDHSREDRLDDIRDNGSSAVLAVDTLTIPVVRGRLNTGSWESIVFIDPDGPGTRHLDITVLGG